jgi:hypothetical protein
MDDGVSGRHVDHGVLIPCFTSEEIHFDRESDRPINDRATASPTPGRSSSSEVVEDREMRWMPLICNGSTPRPAPWRAFARVFPQLGRISAGNASARSRVLRLSSKRGSGKLEAKIFSPRPPFFRDLVQSSVQNVPL